MGNYKCQRPIHPGELLKEEVENCKITVCKKAIHVLHPCLNTESLILTRHIALALRQIVGSMCRCLHAG